MSVSLISVAERPDLVAAASAMGGEIWPDYLITAALLEFWDDLYLPALARFQTLAVDDASGAVIGLGNSVPFWREPDAPLPDKGWDAVLELGVTAAQRGMPVNALSVAIRPAYRGTGLAERLLGAMKLSAQAAGLASMVAPVRPTLKSLYPLQDFATYCSWRRPDGTSFDPWLRTHEALGANVIGPAMASMTMTANVAQWQDWSGLRFPASGLYAIAGALAPLDVDLCADRATYIEPNLWMQHPL